MTARNTLTSEEARVRAEQRFQKASQREKEAEAAMKAEAEAQRQTAAKMEHLRALRLAKEASAPTPLQAEADAEAEKQRADLLAFGKPPAPVKPKRARSTKPKLNALEVN